MTIDTDECMDITDTITLECMVYLSKECTGYIIAKKQSFALAVKKGQLMISVNNTKPGWVWKNTKHFLELNKWKHVAVTYSSGDPADASVFVDGVLVRRFPDMVGPLDHSTHNDLLLGVHLAEEHITGYIAHVRIWKKILAPERLTRLAVARLSQGQSLLSSSHEVPEVDAKDPDLVGWWPLDKGYGAEAEDVTGRDLLGRIATPKWAMCLNKEKDFVPSSLASDFRLMLNNPMGSDIKLRIAFKNDPAGDQALDDTPVDAEDNPSDANGQFLYAHKIILATRCRVFNAMLNGEMRERNLADIYIREISFATLKKLIEFIYTDSVEVDGDHVMDLFGAADKYDLPRLRYLCESFMIENMHSGNVCALYEAAEKYNAPVLRHVSLRFIMANYAEVIITDGFITLNPKSMRDINMEAKKTVFPATGLEEPATKRRKLNDDQAQY